MKNLIVILVGVFVLGLLWEGDRSGQELVENAKITSSASQIMQAIGAIENFKKHYGVLPGDMADPGKIETCVETGGCGKGNGDSIIGGAFGKDTHTENSLLWQHLFAAGFLRETYPNQSAAGWDVLSSLEAGIFIGYHDAKYPLPDVLGEAKEGHYFLIAQKYDGRTFLRPEQAARIDRKMDDGVPQTGRVIAAGNPECLRKNEQGVVVYNEKVKKYCLSLYIYLGYPKR